jgi:hypothetical protein
MHNESSILVSVPEFAARTSLSARHVWRLIREHKIPSHLVGRRRVIPIDPALEALIANDTSRAARKSEGMQMASMSVIPDDDWGSIHGTDKVQGGALIGETDNGGRLQFVCPTCRELEIITRLAGVSNNFVECNHINSNSEIPHFAVTVFEVHCRWCGLADHFKIHCDQHGKDWPGTPLPQPQSRRARRPDEPRTAPILIVNKTDLHRISEKPCRIIRLESFTDYLNLLCPLCGASVGGGYSRMVAAVRDSESKPRWGNLIGIGAFHFEARCLRECGFVGDFTIPVANQTLRLLEW